MSELKADEQRLKDERNGAERCWIWRDSMHYPRVSFAKPDKIHPSVEYVREAAVALTFRRGRDDFHVLRILGNGQISAGKAAELLLALQNGDKPDLPNFEAPAPEPSEIVRVAFCENCRGQSD